MTSAQYCIYMGLAEMEHVIVQYQNGTIHWIRQCDLHQFKTATDLVQRNNMAFIGYVDRMKTVTKFISSVTLVPVKMHKARR